MNIQWLPDRNGNYLVWVDKRCIASVIRGTKGWWTSFNRPISDYYHPPDATCKTLAGIKRRVEKYATLWVIAGRPE